MSRPFIMMHDYGGYAFPVDLSVALAERGYPVRHVYTSASGSPNGAFPSHLPNFSAVDIDIPAVQKSDFYQRWKSERLYGAKVARMIRAEKPDVIISANTPLEAQQQILRACRNVRGKFIYWLQDILSMAMTGVLSQKYGTPGRLVGCHYHRIEKRLLEQSDSIITITTDFVDILKEWRLDTKKAHVLPNWAPIEDIPVRDKKNPFSIEYGLVDKFVVLYSGTMGMKQNPDTVVQAARALKSRDIQFVVISNGVGMEFLAKSKKEYNLDNLLLLPLQPFARLADILASADVGLVLLDPDAGAFCVPSKVWSIYCAARPALLVMAKDNLAARVTSEIDAGIILAYDEANKLPDTLINLRAQPDRLKIMGRNGRRYAESHFRIDAIADQFEERIHALLQ